MLCDYVAAGANTTCHIRRLCLGALMATAIPVIWLDGTATVLSWHGRILPFLEQHSRGEVRTGGCPCFLPCVSPAALRQELPQRESLWTYSPLTHPSHAPNVPGTQEEELVELLARHCYVQLGATVKSNAVQELLPGCVPSKLYRTKSPEKWASLVTTAHAKVSL